MLLSAKLKVAGAAAALVLGLVAPAFAQGLDYDPGYGPRQRHQDDLDRPYELDGLGFGREGALLGNGDLDPAYRPRGRSFEIEGPPIGPALPVLPAGPDLY